MRLKLRLVTLADDVRETDVVDVATLMHPHSDRSGRAADGAVGR
jgi:hypothetical protein